jgi:adenylate cyclase
LSSSERRLAAIMFTDMVGYTALGQRNESLSLALIEEQRRLIRPLLSSHAGREVKTMGDAFLVEFPSALEAVLCAAEIQEKLAERNSAVPEQRKLQVRVGIHVGDVVHGAGDIFGDAVNVASRIEPLAEEGGICVSQQVYDSVRNKTELEFEALGEVELKNVQLPLNVYRIVMRQRGARRAEPRPAKERLAVLPFVNISPDPNDEFFADGLTEELITELSRAGGLKVIARTSVMHYKKKDKKVSEIGRELNVGSIVEGSVRKAGNRIRVTVQLIDARTEEHLWASNYDKDMGDVFAIQTDIASRVAGSITSGSFFKAPTVETKSVEAYTLYIRALQHYHEASESSLRKALPLFDRAISIDPGFVRAYAALSQTWGRLAINGYEDFSVISNNAEPAARRALELDPDSAEGHAALAHVHWVLDRFEDCISEAETAIRINPSLAEAYLSLGVILATVGNFQEAIVNAKKGYELDPLNENVGLQLAFFLNYSGRAAEALPVLERMNALNPRNARIHNRFAECYMINGDFDKAQEWITRGLELNPREPLLRLNQGLLYAFTGRTKEAEASRKEIQGNKLESVRLYGQLFINAALGNLDEAFKALDRTAETHSWPALIKTLPVFAELRKDPRYASFCSKVGLT